MADGVGLNFNFDPVSWFDDGSDTASNDTRFMNDFAWKQSLRNEELQREQFNFNKDLAKHGIKMRADDAIAAGFHPLVGAGVNPAGGSSGGFGTPAFVGAHQSSSRGSGTSVGISQSISRAQAATMTESEKAMNQAQLESIRANTAESMARKALADYELQKLRGTPPIPPATQNYRDADGNIITLNHPDVEASLRSDPVRMWSRSIKRNVYDNSLYKRLQDAVMDRALNNAINRR